MSEVVYEWRTIPAEPGWWGLYRAGVRIALAGPFVGGIAGFVGAESIPAPDVDTAKREAESRARSLYGDAP